MICVAHALVGLLVTLTTGPREVPHCPLCFYFGPPR
jgi:hypothetical protein